MQERLQKIIARAGIASRRHAELLIQSGQVRVNGEVVRELGTKADVAIDKIEAAGKVVGAGERKVYLVLHKPPEIVSSMADPEGRKTLRNFLRGFPERVYPVGNLEYAASGLVFLTNDGDMAAEILRKWATLEQIYHLKVKGMLRVEDLARIGKEVGVRMETVRQPDATRGHAANFWYEVTMQDSKLEELRWLLAKELHPIEKVKRIGLGPLTIEGIPRGRYASLAKKDVEGILLGKAAKIARAKVVPEKKAFVPPQDVEEKKAFAERKFDAQRKDFIARKYAAMGKRPPFVPKKPGEARPEFGAKKFGEGAKSFEGGKKPFGGQNFRDDQRRFGGKKFGGERKESGAKPWGDERGEYESRPVIDKSFRPGQERAKPVEEKKFGGGKRISGRPQGEGRPQFGAKNFGGKTFEGGKKFGGKTFGGKKFSGGKRFGGKKTFRGGGKPGGGGKRAD